MRDSRRQNRFPERKTGLALKHLRKGGRKVSEQERSYYQVRS
jgi:hypothetical protein